MGEVRFHGELGRLARRYLGEVERVAAREQEQAGGGTVVEAFAQERFKLLAYEDEYEVARLHLDAAERAKVAEEYGADARVQLLLRPPPLRTLGLQRKLRLGRGAFTTMRLLRAARRLRGTPLDPVRPRRDPAAHAA